MSFDRNFKHPYPSKFSIGNAVKYLREKLPENYEVIELEDDEVVEKEPNIEFRGTVYRKQYNLIREEDTIATISFDYWTNPRDISSVQMELKGDPEAETGQNMKNTFKGVAEMLEESSKRKETNRSNSRGPAEELLGQR
jgi:hypothetical protein